MDFFAKDWAGEPFILFSGYHLIAIIIILLVNVGIVAFRRRFSPKARRFTRWFLAIILVVDELAWHYWNFVTGQWTVQTMLPLHLCSVLVWLCAYMLVTRNYAIYEFAYLLGIAGALQAVLTPDAGIYGFPHFRSIQVMLSHGTIITSAVYMTSVEGFRPTPRSLVRVLVGANLYMAVVGLVNWAIGSNYLFIAHKPVTASLLDVLPAWPWYILYIEALGVFCCMLVYLPFALKDWRAKKSIGVA